jgi:hypothetical protein
MITEIEYLVAKKDYDFYKRLIAHYSEELPAKRMELRLLNEKIEKKQNGLLNKIHVYFPLYGLDVQRNKLKGYVDLYSELIPKWTAQVKNAEQVLNQHKLEHSGR